MEMVHVTYKMIDRELPDGYLFFAPIVNWRRHKEEGADSSCP